MTGDGSRVNLPYNPSDSDTFIQCIEGRKGINQIHLNCLYDVLNDLFLDTVLQGIHEGDEKAVAEALDHAHMHVTSNRSYNCAESAIWQIREKRYFDSLSHYSGNLLFVGINYDEKTKQHTCRIKKYVK